METEPGDEVSTALPGLEFLPPEITGISSEVGVGLLAMLCLRA
ncbi:MAG TPA: hypothetical protein QF730_10890 [Planctomycetota bacterium]|nr:hypothetical protein [Planctomycetota bacterium]